jgi:hypothetical protein
MFRYSVGLRIAPEFGCRLLSGSMIGSDVFEQFLISPDLPGLRVLLQPLPAIEGRRYDDPESWKEFDRRSIPELNEFMPVRRWIHLLLDTLVNGKVRDISISTRALRRISSARAWLRPAR